MRREPEEVLREAEKLEMYFHKLAGHPVGRGSSALASLSRCVRELAEHVAAQHKSVSADGSTDK